MPMRVGLSSVVLKDGSRVELADPGVTVIVGPNNAGKTLLLREIVSLLESESADLSWLKLLSGVEVTKEGTADELFGWLKQRGFAHPQPGQETSYIRSRGVVVETNLRRMWDRPGFLGSHLRDFLVSDHTTEARLQLVGGAPIPNMYADTQPLPLQILYRDRDATARLSALVERAFGMPVTLNRYSGELRLHLGVPSEPETAPPPPRAYLDELLKLPVVSEQGDGIRSFVGLLLHTLEEMPLVLIDEPEAFLPPPQARLLGRVLVERLPEHTQLIMATHSDDILQGVLEVRDRPVRVVRLTRNGDQATMHTLDPAAIRALWQDPLIRHSQLLDGLFHDAVLVCEADSDSRFYAAVFDELIGDEYHPALLITHCGGKERLPKAVRAVAQFGVRALVIADIDVLADDRLLAELVSALGGDWTTLERDHRTVSAAVTDLYVAPEVATLRHELDRLLDGKTGRLDSATAKAAKALLTVRSGWQEIKVGGVARLPSGNAAAAAATLLEALAELGLFVVPVGQLERWVTTVGGHGPEWVSKVLETSAHLPLTADLADFGRRVLAYSAGSKATPAGES